MNIAQLTKLPKRVLDELPSIIRNYQIDTPLRMAHFLSQCHHESGGFKSTTENMKYSAARLLQVFPRHFKSLNDTKGYAMHSERIGNKVYANRLGNGDESSGDGFRYRGRGYIQCTGKNKYIILDNYLDEDIVANPDLIATKYPLYSAGWYWHSVDLNSIADKGSAFEVCEKVTKKVNGGKIGLESRYKYFVYYYQLLDIR